MHLTKGFLGILLPFLVSNALGAIYEDPSKLPRNQNYDFVIIGAGTAGNVLASRLTENRSFRVLVVEAGRYHEGFQDELIKIPFLGPLAAPGTSFDWNYTTIPQPELNNQNIPFPRGYVLGGSSSINYMAYTRCAKDDYDAFARVAGDDGWSWDKMLPYAIKNEKHVPPNDGHNETGQYIPELHGFDGELQTSLTGFLNELDDRLLAVTQELDEFPFNPDYNSGDTLGISWMHSTVGGPLRSSSATAFLIPAVRSRRNLDLVYNAQVTRLIQTGTERGVPVFRGVEFARSSRSRRYTVRAEKELILAAGAIGTPQILMLSGIGPQDELRQAGVNATVDLPEVGRNLIDHPILPIQWRVNSNNTMDAILRGGAALDAAFDEYYSTGKGRLAANGVSNHLSFLRIPEGNEILTRFGDPTPGKGSPHYEHIFGNGFFTTSQPQPTEGSYFTVVNAIVSPVSNGTVTLASTDPFVHPIIDPKFLESDFDKQAFIYSIRSAQRLAASDAFKDYIIEPYTNLDTDEAILEYMAQWATTIKHPFCTARMDNRDGQGVVDGKLLLKKARGVRIVDASVWPFIPTGHPQAPIYIMAERASDVIKAAWSS